MDGGSNNQFSMDGGNSDEWDEGQSRRGDDGPQGISHTAYQQIKDEIFNKIKDEMQVETVKASREAFVDLVTLLSIRKIVNDHQREKGWIDQYAIDQKADEARNAINDFFNRSDVNNRFNLEGMANDLGKLMDFAGILDVEKFEERMDELNRNFKIVTDMIADPHLALSERVKSFQLK